MVYLVQSEDILGRRIARTIDPDGSPVVTYFYYDGDRVIEETTSGGAVQATYVYGNYVDEVVQMVRDSNTYYYHQDDLHNIVAVTNSSGTVVERYDYGDYGAPSIYQEDGTPLTATAIDNPYLFNGRRWDPETALYYYRTRYLDPTAGRFASRDTIGLWGDTANLGNGQTYVGNNPWTRLDPYGEYGWHPCVQQDAEAAAETVVNLVQSGRAGRVATTGGVVGLNAAAWGFTGPIGGIPVTGFTLLSGGSAAYSNRQAQYITATGQELSRWEGVAIAGGDVTGASAMYTVVSGEDPLTGETVSTGDRLEAGAHLGVGLLAWHGGTRTGGALRARTAPVRNAGARGVEVHEQVVAEYEQAGGTNLGFRHLITDVNVGPEQISVRTVDLASKTYNVSLPPGQTHPLTSALTTKARAMTRLTTPGPKVLRIETYGPRPTAAQTEAIAAAARKAAQFDVEFVAGYRP